MDGWLSGMKSWMGAHIAKFIGVPLGIQMLQFIIDLLDAMSDGVLTHNELVSLFEQGRQIENGASILMLGLAMAWLKWNKKK